MKTFFVRYADRLLLVLAASAVLGGCAVYDTSPGYYDTGDVVYSSPSVYVTPPPVYAPPPTVYFGIHSSSWSHSNHYRGRYNGHGGSHWHGNHRGPGGPGNHVGSSNRGNHSSPVGRGGGGRGGRGHH